MLIEKLPIFLVKTLLLYIPFLALTDRQTKWQNDRGTKYLLHMGWWNSFPSSCVVVSFFWFRREIVFGVTYVLRVQYSCGLVLVFWFWRETNFGVSYTILEYNTAVPLCQCFGCGGKYHSSQNANTGNHTLISCTHFFKNNSYWFFLLRNDSLV